MQQGLTYSAGFYSIYSIKPGSLNRTPCSAHYAENTALIRKITAYFSESKSISGGNAPHHDPCRNVWQQHPSYQLSRLDFSRLPRLCSPLPAPNKRWKPLTCHMGGCFGQPAIQTLFSLPTAGVSKEERCRRISCERSFLYVSNTMASLSVEGRPSAWQGKRLRTCSATQRTAQTHAITFTVDFL